MAVKRIPKREEVPQEMTWDLSPLFENDEEWEKELESLKKAPEQMAAFAGTLGQSAENLLAAFRFRDETGVRLEKLYGYANCKADQDTGNNANQNMRGKALNMYVLYSSASAFFTPEVMAIPEEILSAFRAEKPELEQYARDLYLMARSRAHILSPAEEKLLAAAGEMSGSPENIISTFRDADQKYPDVADENGELHQLTSGSFVMLQESSDRTLRKNAFEAFYGQIAAYKNTIAATLDAQMKQLKFFAEARHYGGTLEASLFPNEVPVEVYKNLITAIHENMDYMHRYVALRKKLLGVEELHMYDVYTAIVADAARKISYEEAKSTVLEALSVMGEDYTALLKEGFENRWIDVYENEGKRGGAYSSGSSRPHPYVLLNHKDNLDSMFTLAHEMGHALHSYHSCKYQPVNTSDYVLFVAEVASTCNEVLLMRYLLNHTSDKKERAYLINHFLESFKGTVYRQTMFAEFEMRAGELSEQGESLTAETLSNLYLELNREYFGKDMVSDELIAVEWARIPHFFYNYYVFQYATGFSCAVALADRILREGEPAVQDYKKFLSGGCSEDPVTLLKIAGVDVTSPETVASALKLFGELIDEMEQLQE